MFLVNFANKLKVVGTDEGSGSASRTLIDGQNYFHRDGILSNASQKGDFPIPLIHLYGVARRSGNNLHQGLPAIGKSPIKSFD